MTDTHTHLYMQEYSGGGQAVERAIAAGVSRMVLPNVDVSSIIPMKELHSRYPENTAMCMGIHPTELGDDPSSALDLMERELEQGGYAAIGEVGIDLHWPDSPTADAQTVAFARQLEWGARYRLPVIIHSRDARDETLAVISAVKESLATQGRELPPLIFHSFTGTSEDVAAIREVCDPWFGINGVVTFKNAPGLREALPVIGAARMLLETDAPYLAPVPHRGQTNESAFIPLILHKIAEVLAIDAHKLEEITDSNAARLFFPQTAATQ